MYNIGSQKLGTYIYDGYGYVTRPLNQYKWRVEMYHRQGGLIYRWYLGQESCPINSIEFENNLNGNGAGKMVVTRLD